MPNDVSAGSVRQPGFGHMPSRGKHLLEAVAGVAVLSLLMMIPWLTGREILHLHNLIPASITSAAVSAQLVSHCTRAAICVVTAGRILFPCADRLPCWRFQDH